MNDGMSRALNRNMGDKGEKRDTSPGEGPNAESGGKKGGKSEFVVESLALENQVSSEQNVLGRLGQEAV